MDFDKQIRNLSIAILFVFGGMIVLSSCQHKETLLDTDITWEKLRSFQESSDSSVYDSMSQVIGKLVLAVQDYATQVTVLTVENKTLKTRLSAVNDASIKSVKYVEGLARANLAKMNQIDTLIKNDFTREEELMPQRAKLVKEYTTQFKLIRPFLKQ